MIEYQFAKFCLYILFFGSFEGINCQGINISSVLGDGRKYVPTPEESKKCYRSAGGDSADPEAVPAEGGCTSRGSSESYDDQQQQDNGLRRNTPDYRGPNYRGSFDRPHSREHHSMYTAGNNSGSALYKSNLPPRLQKQQQKELQQGYHQSSGYRSSSSQPVTMFEPQFGASQLNRQYSRESGKHTDFRLVLVLHLQENDVRSLFWLVI